MDLNQEYAAHQRAVMVAGEADGDERTAKLAQANRIADRIGVFQHGLGAAAACAWSNMQIAASARLTVSGKPAI